MYRLGDRLPDPIFEDPRYEFVEQDVVTDIKNKVNIIKLRLLAMIEELEDIVSDIREVENE